MSVIKRLLKPLPNTLTLLNLVSGCLALTAAFGGRLQLAGVLIIVSGVFDFFDGFAARLLGVHSELGRELDSLADVVSFGVAPSVILYQFMNQALMLEPTQGICCGRWLLLVPFFVAAMSGLRLAKFNLDTRQTSTFFGLATPANALLVAGLAFGLDSRWSPLFQPLLQSAPGLAALSVVLGLMLVMNIPMFSLKIKSLRPKVAYKQIILFAGALVLLGVFGKAALTFIIIWYIILSIVFWLIQITTKP